MDEKRGRGRPKKTEIESKKDIVSISFTQDEMKKLLLASANDGCRKVTDFIRKKILEQIEGD